MALAGKGSSVTLFEASNVAAGASGGLGERGVRANGRDVRELPLIRWAHQIWPELTDRLSGPTGFRRIGHLWLAEREEDLGRLDAQCALQNQHGLPSELLDGPQVRQLEPELHDGVRQALLCGDDGVADHTATTRSFAAAASKAGAEVREGTPVDRVWLENGKVKGVLTSAGDAHPAGRGIILLANQSVGQLLARGWNVQLPLWPVVPQALVTEPTPQALVNHLIGHSSRRLSVKPLLDGRVMVSGGWRGRWAPPTDVSGVSGVGEVIQGALTGNWNEATAVFPVLAELAIEQAVADRPETMCIDGVPIIDQLDCDVPVWFGAGWTGHGWAIAPAVAELLAEWVLSGDRPGPLAPFALARFGT